MINNSSDLAQTSMIRILLISLLFTLPLIGQTETLTNASVVEMSRAGLPADLILKKIGSSRAAFDVSAPGLIELKKAGIDDSIIAFMMERHETMQGPATGRVPVTPVAYSESVAPSEKPSQSPLTSAKTIAFKKSSLQPSRQALEKELMKRKDFQAMNISILRYKEQADLFVEIGYISGSWISHRYVYRVYDRHSGAVVAAGETTSWGSLAANLARNIARSLTAARAGKLV